MVLRLMINMKTIQVALQSQQVIWIWMVQHM